MKTKHRRASALERFKTKLIGKRLLGTLATLCVALLVTGGLFFSQLHAMAHSFHLEDSPHLSRLSITAQILVGVAMLIALGAGAAVARVTRRLKEDNRALRAEVAERKRAEESLQRQRIELRALFDVIPAMIWFKDTENRILRVNQRVIEATGQPAVAIEGKTTHEVYPEEGDRLFADDTAVIESGVSQIGIVEKVSGQDGQERWFQTDRVPYYDRGGKVLGLVVMAQDVTERKRAEIALRESEERFQTMANSMAQLAWIARADGSIFWYNQRWYEYTGTKPDQMEGWGWQSVHDPEMLAEVVEKWQSSIASGEPFEMEFPLRGADGRFRSFLTRVQPLKDAEGRVLQWFGTNTDVEALKVAEARFRRLVDSNVQGVLFWNTKGQITDANEAFLNLVGYTRADLAAGRLSWEQMTPPEFAEHYTCALHQLGTTGVCMPFENQILRQDGTPVPILIGAAMFDENPDEGVCFVLDLTARKRAETALQESEERLRLLAKATNDATWDWNLRTKILQWNEGFERLFGYGRSQVDPAADSWMVGIHPEDVARVTEGVHRAIQEGAESWTDEYRFPRRDGSYAQVLNRGHIIRDGAGRAVRMVGGMTDLTEAKRKEAELRFNEQRYRWLAEATSAIVWDTPPSGTFEIEQPRWTAFTGQSFEQLRGWGWLNAIHPDDRAETGRAWKEALAGRSIYEVEHRMLTRDQTYRHMMVQAVPITAEDGTIIQWIGVHIDITERKLAEEALRKERELLAVLLESVADGILACDAKGVVTMSNRALRDLHGIPTEPISSERWAEYFNLYLPDGETPMTFEQTPLFRALHEGAISEMELVIAPLHKQRRRALVSGQSFSDSEDAKAGAVIIVRDITERKQAELELRAAKEAAEAASRAKSQFLANMSHEIRTPMNGVIGMTSLLLDTTLTEEQRDFTETIRASGENLLRVINEILDFSKIEAGKLAIEICEFDLQEVVEGTIELLAETACAKGLELSGFTHPAVPPFLRGDAGRLRQILTNLVSNAIKFTAAGQVALHVEMVSETATHATLSFRVRDTGIGITPEVQDRLFQAFSQGDASTTRKYGGTGLGLAISKHLVETMGGEIGVESVPGAGSTFWFTLPLEKQAQAYRLIEDGHALEGVRVLIVDDDATNRENLQTQLAAWKIASETADGGELALETLRLAAQKSAPFAAAMIDQGMPAMSGLELARNIQGDPAIASTRLILLTTRTQRLEAEELQGAGIVDRRLKPVRQSLLFDCLVNCLADAPAFVNIPTQSAGPSSIRHKERILLAEDNAVNQRVALGNLRKLGYSADAVANGFEALEALSRIAYDIVLMDCHMPELDGYEATMAIRQREGSRKHTRIIAMTANAMAGDREQCLAAGMDDYISKPVRLKDLENVLARARQQVAAAPAIDPRSLEELRELPDEHGQSLLRSLLEHFIESAPAGVATLAAAIERGDLHAAAFSAHELKGSCSSFGAHRLQELCGEMERAGKAGLLDPLPALLTLTQAEVQRVLAALNHELQLLPV